ncbi:Excinuclease ABC subunit B, partial [human gut metagenome]
MDGQFVPNFGMGLQDVEYICKASTIPGEPCDASAGAGDVQWRPGRKKSLIDFGFRLPSAYDNRPLTFDEFHNRIGQAIYVSATPADYERERASQIAEQVIRPTGLLDPEVFVRPIEGQIDDLI